MGDTETTGRDVLACPECDSTHIRRRSDRAGGDRKDDRAYRCPDCGSSFDEPVKRKADHPGPSATAILDRAFGKAERADSGADGGDE